MALISCPECGKQISETTPSCPHCGYLLSSAPQQQVPTPTKIGEIKTTPAAGIVFILIGVVGLIAAIFTLIVFLPFGILALIGAIGLLGIGIQRLSGTQDAYCPHCGKLTQLGKSAVDLKCPICKKRSVRDGEYLKPIL